MFSTANSVIPPQNFSSIISESIYPPPVIILPRPSLINGIPDGILALIAPIVAYWAYSTFFHLVDVYELAEKYRIHPSEEELKKNRATMSDVIKDVILQHIIQSIVGYLFYKLDPPPTTGFELYQMWYLKQNYLPSFTPNFIVWSIYMYGWSLLRISCAFVLIDSWQYWLHRLMHVNKTLYRHFHSRHHRLHVPYSYGALYNHPFEGFLLDTAGTGIAAMVTFLTPRESIVLYTFATLKTVDDHCGYRLPYDLFQIIFPNNSIYHDIHHQSWGLKHNFSQPFFTVWDKISKTEYEFVNEYKELQDKITLVRYKDFLANKKYKTNSSKSNVNKSTPTSKTIKKTTIKKVVTNDTELNPTVPFTNIKESTKTTLNRNSISNGSYSTSTELNY